MHESAHTIVVRLAKTNEREACPHSDLDSLGLVEGVSSCWLLLGTASVVTAGEVL